MRYMALDLLHQPLLRGLVFLGLLGQLLELLAGHLPKHQSRRRGRHRHLERENRLCRGG